MASLGRVRITRGGISFVIIAIALIAVVFGSVYTVQQRGEQVRREEALQIALDNLEKESAGPAVIATAPPKESPDTPTAGSGTTAGSSSAPAVLPQTGPTDWMIVPLVLVTYALTYVAVSARTVLGTRLSSVFRVK